MASAAHGNTKACTAEYAAPAASQGQATCTAVHAVGSNKVLRERWAGAKHT